MKKIVFGLLLFLSFGLFGQEAQLSCFGGMYQSERLVSIKSEKTVLYSLDGSLPYIRYSESIKIDSSCILRYGFMEKGSFTEQAPEFYLINAYHSLPVVSIQTAPDNLFHPDSGIYMLGPHANEKTPHKGANFWSNKEVKAHFQYIENGKTQIKQDIGIRIFGGYSRSNAQKSIALIARKSYGNKKIKYPFFKNRQFKSYKALILRNSGNDFNKSMLRDAYYTNVCAEMGLDFQSVQPTVVYINGMYWGIMNLREKINEHYLKQHHGINKDSLDLLKHRYDRQHGSNSAYKKLLKWLENADLSLPADSAYFASKVDIENFMKYNIVQVFSDNRDAGGNIRYYREGKNGKWRWILFDLDAGLNNGTNSGYKSNTLQKMTTYSDEAWPNPAWSTLIIRKILQNKSWEKQYIALFHFHLNTTFKPDKTRAILDSMTALIAGEMRFHKMKWGGTLSSFEREINSIGKFMQERPENCMRQLSQRFNLGEPQKFYTDFEGQNAKVFFKGIPLSACDELMSWELFKEDLKIIPEKGFQVVDQKWESNVLKIQLEKKKSVERALFITAINPTNDEVELTNVSNRVINLQYYQISDAKDEHITRLPGILLHPDEKIRLSGKDTVGGRIKIPFRINKKRDKIRLFNSQMLLLEEVMVNNGSGDMLALNFNRAKAHHIKQRGYSTHTGDKGYVFYLSVVFISLSLIIGAFLFYR